MIENMGALGAVVPCGAREESGAERGQPMNKRCVVSLAHRTVWGCSWESWKKMLSTWTDTCCLTWCKVFYSFIKKTAWPSKIFLLVCIICMYFLCIIMYALSLYYAYMHAIWFIYVYSTYMCICTLYVLGIRLHIPWICVQGFVERQGQL